MVHLSGKNNKYPSGINTTSHSIVDIDLFKLSKKALLNTPNGILSEQKKLDLIDQAYTTNNVRFTKFYRQLRQELRNIKAIQNQQMTKADAQHKFREIISVNAIPEEVYLQNQDSIDHAQTILDESGHTPKEYQTARKTIKNLSLDIPAWIAYQNHQDLIKRISNDVVILDRKIKYDDQLGLDSQISKN